MNSATFRRSAIGGSLLIAALLLGNAGPSAAPVWAPLAPASASAVGGDSQVTVTWAAVSTATTYRVYRSLTSGSYSGTATATVTAPTTTFNDVGLENGPLYFYTVIAVNSTGSSPRSPQASAYTEAPRLVVDAETTAAFRLLRQTTWGPRPSDAEYVKQIGRPAYIDGQFGATPSTYPDALLSATPSFVQRHFLNLALSGPDQLRQRVAWALHKIWVVSANDSGSALGLVLYNRIFLERAFGNYRDVMKDVTLTPAMGKYLTMVNNRSQAVSGSLPNENYARELMQLFTIGLQQLNADGTPVLVSGNPVPTYTDADVRALARIFTGWTYGDGNPATAPTALATANYLAPMEPVAAFHDTGAKTFLGETFTAGASATADLDHALDVLFNHPNAGPFVASQLIKQLVRSNPSPAYVRDIAAVFNNNGVGVRGDLQAVVRAILLHAEASDTSGPVAGKLSEPVLFATSILRSLNAISSNLTSVLDQLTEMGQRVFYPPSVFSYFSPSFAISGIALPDGSPITGPEFQILTTVTATTRANFVAQVLEGLGGTLAIDRVPFTNRARDAAALVDYCNQVLMGGRMTTATRDEIIAAVRKISITSTTERANTALYLTFVMGQTQVDR